MYLGLELGDGALQRGDRGGQAGLRSGGAALDPNGACALGIDTGGGAGLNGEGAILLRREGSREDVGRGAGRIDKQNRVVDLKLND